MKRSLFIFFLILFATFNGIAQNSTIQLTRLSMKSKALELIMGDIDGFIGNKTNGYIYPVTKIVFTEYDDSTQFCVMAIDNSWSQLFSYPEQPYGYAIVNSRLFVVSSDNCNQDLLSSFFESTSNTRVFNRNPLGPSFTKKNPSWFFEYKDRKCIFLDVEDLDILE